MLVFAELFPFFFKYLEAKINGWLRTQVRSTAPRCLARHVFDKTFLVRLRF